MKKLLSLILTLVLLASVMTLPFSVEAAGYDLSFDFSFGEISIDEGENGKVVSVEGLEHFNDPGKPDIPSKSVSILIPADKDVKSVSISTGEAQVFEDVLMEPAQEYTYSLDGDADDVPFVFDEAVYSGQEKYPQENYTGASLVDIRGYSVYSLLLFPVSCQGTTVTYTPDMQVNIELKDLKEPLSDLDYIPDESDEDFIDDCVENMEAAQTYYEKANVPSGKSTLLGSGSVNYVIITQKAFVDEFKKLIKHKKANGLSAKIVTTTDIYKTYDGRDKAEQIRNFIKDAYKVNRIKYVLLGGSAHGTSPRVPTRLLYCEPVNGDSSVTTQIAADMYFGCLSGDYDYNGNWVFGEPWDGVNGGEVDLTYEVYVGRAPINSVSEVKNFVKKTIAFEKRKKPTKATFVGEVLDGSGGDCAVEVASGFQSDVDALDLSNCMRDLRDKKISDEYTSLYYESNGFIKSLILNDIGLMADFSACMARFYGKMNKYLSTGDGSYKITATDAKKMSKLCQKLSDAAKASDYVYNLNSKKKLIAVFDDLSSYLGGCEGKTLKAMIEGGKFYSANGTTGDFDKLAYTFGGDYMDEIRRSKTKSKIGDSNFNTKGFPTKYVRPTLYDRDQSNYDWPKKKVIYIMNNSPEVINHLGHADVDYVMKCTVSNMKKLKNTQAFFLYTQGCYAGSYDYMDSYDYYGSACITETMIKTSGKSGAVACIANSRYGWYSKGTTEGPSQYYHRKFWDRIFSAKPAGRQIGVAMAKSKHYFIPHMSTMYDGSSVMRFCYYTENLLGDPQTKLYDRTKAAKVPAKGITLNIEKSLSIVKGQKVCIKPMLSPITSTDKVKWTSSNKKIVSVSKTGVITAKKAGKVIITAKTTSGKKAKLTVKVPKKVSKYKTNSIKLNKKKATIDRGKRTDLKATINGSAYGKKWYSSNPRVATVDQYGRVRGKSRGSCKIYCRTAYGKKAICKVKVQLPE